MEYIEALTKELRNTYFALAFLVLVAVAVLVITIISSISFYKDLKGFAKAKRKKKKRISNRKRDFISLCASLSFLLIIVTLGIISLSSKALDLKYDIDNEAIVVSTEDFSVTMEAYYPYKSKTRQDYYITFKDSSDELCIKERLVYDASLTEGEYTGYTVVYSKRSQLVLDVFKTKH